MNCEDPANTALWARVHPNTSIDIRGDLLPLADDLKQLPVPFVDPAVVQPVSIPVVFPAQPSFKAIQAAGIVASYFGLVSADRPCVFRSTSAPFRRATSSSSLKTPQAFRPASIFLPLAGPPWPCAPTPTIPTAKFSSSPAPTPTTSSLPLRPSRCTVTCSPARRRPSRNLTLPAKQAPDAAPRWARTDQTIPLWDYATAGSASGRWDRSAQCLLPHSARPLLRNRRRKHPPASRLSLQLHSHRPYLQPAGAHQQRIPRIHSAHSRPGCIAHHNDRCPRSRRQPAPIFKHALVRLHLPACAQTELRQHHAHQSSGLDSSRLLSRPARLSALDAAAQS